MAVARTQSVVVDDGPTQLDVTEMFNHHADFVWRTLGRFGVREVDRADQLQEVFLVVHRQLPTYRREGAPTTWLFGIARRVAASYRRRGYRNHELTVAEVRDPEAASANDAPDRVAELREAQNHLEKILERMNLDQRAVFVMFEIDGLTGREIAEMMDCPLQTVFSRLRRAREIFQEEVERMQAEQTEVLK